jgi:hypothetical protein
MKNTTNSKQIYTEGLEYLQALAPYIRPLDEYSFQLAFYKCMVLDCDHTSLEDGVCPRHQAALLCFTFVFPTHKRKIK